MSPSPRPVAAAATAMLLALLAGTLQAAEPEDDPKPPPAERISHKSPDGRYALRITYDAELHEQLTGATAAEDDPIDAYAIGGVAIVSLPGKEIMADFTEKEFQTGGTFGGIKLLWSSDSKWCAYYDNTPRMGYTSVLHLAGDKFKLAHKPEDLSIPTKGQVRNEYIAPVRWVKPGVLELSVERIYRGEEPRDDTTGFTASFDGRGKWKVLKKKR